jgi:hypothetical protein
MVCVKIQGRVELRGQDIYLKAGHVIGRGQIGKPPLEYDVDLAKPGPCHVMLAKLGMLCAELSVTMLSGQMPYKKKHAGAK